MKKVIVPLVLGVAFMAIGVFLFQNYQPRIRSQSNNRSGIERPKQQSKSAHPRLEAYRFLEQETPEALVYEWIPYYYRHPRPKEIAGVIEVLLLQENGDPARMGAQTHFFATILHEHPEELEKLKSHSFRYSGKPLARLITIIKETENYQPVKEISPASLDYLWVEFMATGNKEIVTRMIQALDPSKSNNQQLAMAIQGSFFKYLPQYSDAFKAFGEICKNTPGALGSTLEEIKKTIHETRAEPANMHLVRADNYIKQGGYAQALDEFEKSLEYYPDYPNVYLNLANLYDRQGKRQEAFAAMQKAAQIDPTRPWTCYGLGRQYLMRGNYQDAITWFSKALEYLPQNPSVVHALARSYQKKGDTANAVKYFQQYLQYAPTGEYVVLVKQYLAAVSVPAPAARSTAVFDSFKNKDFDSLEKQFAVLLKEKRQDSDGFSLLSHAYSQICDYRDAKYDLEKWLRNFEDWLKNKPSSHFSQAAMGIFYIRYAWHARGSGWANTVTKEGYRLFQERLLKARDYLEKAYRLNSSDPIVPSKLIVVAMGLGLDYPEMEKQFKRALQADSTEFSAYSAKLTYLMPKWLGSKELMFSFARKTARDAPANSLAPLVLAKAHWEMYCRSDNPKWYFRQPEVWSEVKAVYSTLCRRFPKSKERHNWFALTAYLAGDFQTAKQELAIIHDNWSSYVWGNYAHFTAVKREVLSK